MASDGTDERSPLLPAQNSGNVTPTAPPYLQEGSSPRAELPPPYTAIASPDAGGVPVINCRVCQSLINLDGKLHQHVVKCTVCNEATPIKNPPTGKKYVRCPCNCLLICKDTSRRIGCPRPNCRRIINLSPVMVIPEEQPAQPALPVQPEGMRVVCGHCGNTFLGSDAVSQPSSGLPIDGASAPFKWMELRFNTLAKCPHCKKISSVGSALPRRRCCAYITVGMICIFIGIGLTVGTQDFASRYHATYVSWAFAYLLGLICLMQDVRHRGGTVAELEVCGLTADSQSEHWHSQCTAGEPGGTPPAHPPALAAAAGQSECAKKRERERMSHKGASHATQAPQST
ncbi:hypothetical protein AOLI_G00302710 [Acnodon oligacanthus]